MSLTSLNTIKGCHVHDSGTNIFIFQFKVFFATAQVFLALHKYTYSFADVFRQGIDPPLDLRPSPQKMGVFTPSLSCFPVLFDD